MDAKPIEHLSWIRKIKTPKAKWEEASFGHHLVMILRCRQKNQKLVIPKKGFGLSLERIRSVIPRGLILPDQCGFIPVRDTEYKNALLLRGLQILARYIPIRNQVLKIFDPDGKGEKIALQMARQYHTVAVITTKTKEYEQVQEQVLEECGAAMLVSDNQEILAQSKLKLFLSDYYQVMLNGQSAFCISDRWMTQATEWIKEYNLTIEPEDLLAALSYEPKKEEEDFDECDSFIWKGKTISILNAAQLLQ